MNGSHYVEEFVCFPKLKSLHYEIKSNIRRYYSPGKSLLCFIVFTSKLSRFEELLLGSNTSESDHYTYTETMTASDCRLKLTGEREHWF